MKQKPPSTNVVDLKETFQVTARRGCMDDENSWPELSSFDKHTEQQQGLFQHAIKEMITNTHALACRILSLLESKLVHIYVGERW